VRLIGCAVPTAEEEEEKKNRDDIRHDRQADRRRDRNLARSAPTKQAKLRADKVRSFSCFGSHSIVSVFLVIYKCFVLRELYETRSH